MKFDQAATTSSLKQMRVSQPIRHEFSETLSGFFSSTDITVLLPDKKTTHEFSHEMNTKAPEGAVTGAATGGVLGGALGLLAGIGALAIPG